MGNASVPHIYRPDIDGLRALAVLSVIGFHAFPTTLPGGFVGVDVFFVISGFLISQQLFEACDRGGVRIADFYIRRVRRIVPALLAVLIAVLAFGWIAMAPKEFSNLQRHVAASALFSNNILLWSESGYFDAPARTKPLLHLWSLGVEEQFYLVWPWLIALTFNRRWRRTLVIGAIAIVSLATCLLLSRRGHTAAAFYLPHARLWQIASGAFLAAALRGYGEERADTARAHILSAAGVAMICAAVVLIGRGSDAALGYPDWTALLPTGGAMLVIAAGPRASLNRFILSNSVSVWIGLISYPLYLWHWPLLSFLDITESGHPAKWLIASALIASFALAAISYYAIELPLRTRIDRTTPCRAWTLAIGLATIGVLMIAALATGAWLPPQRVATALDEIVPGRLNEAACQSLMRLTITDGYCQQFLTDRTPVTTVLYGDSHASHLLPGLGAVLARRHANVVHVGDNGCPPLVGIEHVNPTPRTDCAALNRAIMPRITAMSALHDVIISFRVLAYTVLDEPGFTPVRLSGTTQTGEAAVEEGLTRTVDALLAAGKRVTLVLPAPRVPFNINECVGRPFSFEPRPLRNSCAIPLDQVMAAQRDFRNFTGRLQQELSITVLDPLAFLCHDGSCAVVEHGQPYYSDNTHLGVAGSMKVSPMFER